ncbi:hypothetical protein MRB53_023351 [Persea americana]|uniref:Uncharacterized protein n=1 Tax=Persea americana TaxID=3435 RepID=A0ACC2LAD6_PERAE|nr:hypothetical protein MRB53_023351 [Persea americana]
MAELGELKELRSAWQVATERAAACCIVGNGGGVDVAESRKALLRNLWTERIHGAKQNRNLWTERIHGAKQNVEYDDSSMMKLVFPLSCCTLPVGNGVGVDVAERRKALFRNMWTERIHGAKQDVEDCFKILNDIDGRDRHVVELQFRQFFEEQVCRIPRITGIETSSMRACLQPQLYASASIIAFSFV